MTASLGRKVGSEGPPDARLMLVGEAPGFEEVKEGRPFVGVAGKILRQFLMSSGIDPGECYLTNMARYRPPRNDLSKWFDAGVPNSIVLEGLTELKAELESVRPNLVLAFGNYPTWALTGQSWWNRKTSSYSGITSYRGSLYDCRLVPGIKVLPTFHPAYIAREGMKDHGTWLADLARAKREAEFPEIRRPWKQLHVVKGDNVLQIVNTWDRESPRYVPAALGKAEVFQRLTAPGPAPLTVDIEYAGSKLLCVGLTRHRDEAFCVVIQGPADVAFVKYILESGTPLNAQNAAYEASILEHHYGIEVMPHVGYDTMLAAHAANIELPKDLGYLTSIYTDQPYHKGMVNWEAVRKGTQDLDVLWKYNCIDTWTEHEIMEEQLKHDLPDPRIEAVFRHEMELLPVLWEMSRRGMKVDVKQLDVTRSRLQQEIEQFQTILDAFAGRHINVKSGPNVSWLLFEHLGIKPGKLNKTGPATDDKTLGSILPRLNDVRQSTAINLIRDIRQRRDLISKFLDVSLDADGRYRGHYNPGGTNTGRLSSSKFYPTGTGGNLQNIPRDKRVRSLFIADRGMEFAYADLERAESLVVAHITQDPRMLADHAPGADAHRSLASVLFSKPQEEINGDERYLGKVTRHAGNYMQGWKTLQITVNQKAAKTGVVLTAPEAKRLINTYREIHPFLPQWWRAVRQQLWNNRQLVTLLGRVRTFYGHIESIIPEAVAFVPQGTVGDVLNVGLLALHDRRSPLVNDEQWEEKRDLLGRLQSLGFQALNQVHDAVGYQYPVEHRFEVNSLVRQLLSWDLEAPKTFEVFRIPVEIQVGPSWGQVELWEEDITETATSVRATA